MRMATLRDPDTDDLVRVPEADDYEGYPDWSVVAVEEWPTLGMLQAEAWGRVKAIRADKLLVAPTDFGTAQTDLESMVKINGLVSMAMLAKQASQPFAETFTMADNSEVELNADQMIGFGVEVGRHIAAVHARGRELRAEIDAASSADELEAIDLEAGWPS